MQYRKALTLFIIMAALVASSCKKDSEHSTPPPENLTNKHSSEVATEWFTLITDITRSRPYVPPQTVRILSYSGLALYESVVKGMPGYKSLYTHYTNDQIPAEAIDSYYWPAVANAALASIAPRVMSHYGNNPFISDIQEMEQTFNTGFLSAISQEKLDKSRTLGILVADKIYAWSLADGTFNADTTMTACSPYTPLGTPGSWEPTPPTFFPGVGNCQGTLRTFVPNIVTTVLPPPPPAFSTDPSSTFYQAAVATYNMRNNMTVDDEKISASWQDLVGTNYNTPAHVVHLTAKLADDADMNLEEASILFAEQTMSIFDAVVSSFHAKFHYNLLRPVTYIHNELGHTTWSASIFTPQHPSYTSTMTTAASAGFSTAAYYFGNNYTIVEDSHDSLYGTWTYNSFDAIISDVKRARTVSGVNFVFAADAAVAQGKAVAQHIHALPFKR